jgi:hypothetical protein
MVVESDDTQQAQRVRWRFSALLRQTNVFSKGRIEYETLRSAHSWDRCGGVCPLLTRIKFFVVGM